jgi:hypothetical protein
MDYERRETNTQYLIQRRSIGELDEGQALSYLAV